MPSPANWRYSIGTRRCCIRKAPKRTASDIKPRSTFPGLALRNRVADRARSGQRDRVSTRAAHHADGFAGVRRNALPNHRAGHRWRRATLRLHLAGDSDRAHRDARPEQVEHYKNLVKRNRRAVRLAALSQLSFSVHAERSHRQLRPGTSRIERRSRWRAHPDRRGRH